MSKRKGKPVDIHAEPMNDIGEFPAAETILAWNTGVDPSSARSTVELIAPWMVDPDFARNILRHCESPMERLFLLGFMMKGAKCEGTKDYVSGLEILIDGRGVALFPQVEVHISEDPTHECEYDLCVCPEGACACSCSCDEPFARVDFSIQAGEEGPWRLAVEIDGHDFHERTKEQASSDRARDRLLSRCGYTVVRFTGSDVWSSPLLCAAEIVRMVRSLRMLRPEPVPHPAIETSADVIALPAPAEAAE